MLDLQDNGGQMNITIHCTRGIEARHCNATVMCSETTVQFLEKELKPDGTQPPPLLPASMRLTLVNITIGSGESFGAGVRRTCTSFKNCKTDAKQELNLNRFML